MMSTTKRGFYTEPVQKFCENEHLMEQWQVLCEMVKARMKQLNPNALYPEQIMFEVSRYLMSKAQAQYIEREMKRTTASVLGNVAAKKRKV